VKHSQQKTIRVTTQDAEYHVSDGAVAIAAITSCTNTSNPSVMLGAGLVAQKAVQHGIDVKPWVKTSLAPGSQVVTDYLKRSNLLEDLEALRFHLVGYGCTTCIGNSGPLPPEMEKAVSEGDLVLSSVLSGNRNFEARVHPQVKMNFLASPMLVVAYAIAGRVDINLLEEPLAYDPNNRPVYLKDIWPDQAEINQMIQKAVDQKDYEETYAHIFEGEDQWQQLEAPDTMDYQWSDDSTYIKEAPFFRDISPEAEALTDIHGARVLLKLGDSVTTDHISPAGAIKHDSAAGQYLEGHGVQLKDFNSYGSRRGNHEVMVRGTFANVRIKNQLASQEGGFTTHFPSGKEMYVYDAAMKYQAEQTPLVVLAGKEYGTGSSRDWAAKGTRLLGVRAVIAESYERIHRSNLVGMGVLPLEYINGENAEKLGLDGTESFEITGISDNLKPGKLLNVTAEKPNGEQVQFQAKARLDSAIEIAYYQNGGILNYVLRQFLNQN
jgi:aconitate hydratase